MLFRSRGRARIAVVAGPSAVMIPVDGASIKLTIPANGVAGVQSLHERADGEKLPYAPGLRVFALDGDLQVEAGGATESLPSGSALTYQVPDKFGEKVAEPPPPWLAEPAATPAEIERGKALASYFKPDTKIESSLAEA